jgi:Thioredoxin-like domain
MSSRIRRVAFVAAMICFALPGWAHADAQSAALAYYRNLERSNYDTSRQATSIARPILLVHGVYRLEDRDTGTFLALITDRGDLRADSSGWSRVAEGEITALSADEMAQVRAEVMRNVVRERLIKIEYGTGGGRELILVSAVDCPYCAKMEATLAQMSGSLQTTFYVLPTALAPLDAGGTGSSAWASAAALWCAPENALAWRHFWLTRSAPSVQGCDLDAKGAQRAAQDFITVMASIGTKVRGTPGLIREDGKAFGVPEGFDLEYARAAFGADTLHEFHSPLEDRQSFVWLPAAAR